MEPRTISGQYRIDPGAGGFFGARTVHFRQIESGVLGRFGRHGTLKGAIDAGVLHARWQNDANNGWVVLRFDDRYAGFQGEYGTYEPPAGMAPLGTIAARRDVRKRAP
jgi:hypothetical protein